MKTHVMLAAFGALLISATTAAAANRPVDHPASRGWLYADRSAQAAAAAIFPRSQHAFGTVTRTRGCDLQQDGRYLCSYDLRVWTSGRFIAGRPTPRSIETWACSGPLTVEIRRRADGAIQRRSDADPCRPRGAADAHDAGLLFVAAVHRRRPAAGRLSALHCYEQRFLGGPSFHCYAASTQAGRVSGDIASDGGVTLDTEKHAVLPPRPSPEPTTYVPDCRAGLDGDCPQPGSG